MLASVLFIVSVTLRPCVRPAVSHVVADVGARFVDFIDALTGGAGGGDGVVEALEQVCDQLAPLFPQHHERLLAI
jgi:hypothetical protein